MSPNAQDKTEFITDLDEMLNNNSREMKYLEDLVTQLRKTNDNPMLLAYYDSLLWLTTGRNYTLSSIRFALTA